jgi:hypothetical protein
MAQYHALNGCEKSVEEDTGTEIRGQARWRDKLSSAWKPLLVGFFAGASVVLMGLYIAQQALPSREAAYVRELPFMG